MKAKMPTMMPPAAPALPPAKGKKAAAKKAPAKKAAKKKPGY